MNQTVKWLDVPFGQKDQAKRLGARWDPRTRRWYAPPGTQGRLVRWFPPPALPVVIPGENRNIGTGLYADPIPSSSWFRNVRSAVSEADWRRISTMVRSRADWTCEACGWQAITGMRHLMDCHERWVYNEKTGVQKLVRLIALCAACHGVTHIGLARITGEEEAALGHLQFVTGMSYGTAVRHCDDALARTLERSRVDWRVDLSLIRALGVKTTRAS
jgi:hypothetical protein